MTYTVKTEVFEGPLDLLVQLVSRHQVEVTSLSLVDLVNEYLGYLEEMRSLDLDVTSEFLLVAATLIQLKARRLLPDPPERDDDLELVEERDRLVARLLQCVTFKDVAAVLATRLDAFSRLVPRASDPHPEMRPKPADVVVPVGAEGLAAIAKELLTPAEPDLDHLELDLPSVEAAIEDLRARVAAAAETTFEELTSGCRRRVEVAAYFLALLELARWGVVAVSQEHWLADIVVTRRE
ncbi:MAG: segregation/condensation protein A [Acidimicrobiia bacterium]|nr:MAG: segregation/condensation protein A [Acidimicrobiia bacterium]